MAIKLPYSPYLWLRNLLSRTSTGLFPSSRLLGGGGDESLRDGGERLNLLGGADGVGGEGLLPLLKSLSLLLLRVRLGPSQFLSLSLRIGLLSRRLDDLGGEGRW